MESGDGGFKRGGAAEARLPLGRGFGAVCRWAAGASGTAEVPGTGGVAGGQAKASRAAAFGRRKGSRGNRGCTWMHRAARRVTSVSGAYTPLPQNR